jgi:chaperonin GroEL
MSLFTVNKPKSAGKIMVPSGTELTNVILETLDHMSQMAGRTLGPGGRQELLERSEINMKPIITKDGVTVVKSLGYDNSVRQLILEAARDAALRTATEAGDGTTTATVLSAAICRETMEIVKNNPKISPQRIVREMQKLVPSIMSQIDTCRIKVDGDNYQETLMKVATLSANGDVELSKKIIEGLDLVGEDGDMTIVEMAQGGESRYAIEKINGYTVQRGLEESCKNFAQGFINDRTGTMAVLEKPIFILYDGVINDFMQVFESLNVLYHAMNAAKRPKEHTSVVLVAHGFSDSALGDLHMNWNHQKSALKIFPLVTPELAIMNWRTNLLYDLQAYTGTPVFNPVDRPLTDMSPESLLESSRVKRFECSRFKAMIFADEDEEAIEIRVNELKEQRKNPESDYELNDLNVRIGKLTSGIVRFNIYGSSSGETREKRDRAEDAWMAIKGAIKHGAVPGGGYVLLRLAAKFTAQAPFAVPPAAKYAMQILGEAFLEPVKLLYRNYGYNEESIDLHIGEMLLKDYMTYDILEEQFVPKENLLDSLPAVAEAIRNSISIASLLGTLGGIVAFKRDHDTDKEEERLVRQFEAAIGERGSLSGDV